MAILLIKSITSFYIYLNTFKFMIILGVSKPNKYHYLFFIASKINVFQYLHHIHHICTRI